jgi:hypothetical protein
MTPERLRQCCDILCWSTGALVHCAGVSPVTARRWLNGQRNIPSDVADAIEAMVISAARLRIANPNVPVTTACQEIADGKRMMHRCD